MKFRASIVCSLITEMWGQVLFWAFLVTTVIYLVFGMVCAVCQRAIQKGAVRLLLPLLYLGYGELKVLFTDAIASKSPRSCDCEEHTTVLV